MPPNDDMATAALTCVMVGLAWLAVVGLVKLFTKVVDRVELAWSRRKAARA